MSCGRENTRFWEIKRGCVRGTPVILNQYARGCEFTDLAFESSYGPRATDLQVQRRVFVASTAGTLLQVCDSRTVLTRCSTSPRCSLL